MIYGYVFKLGDHRISKKRLLKFLQLSEPEIIDVKPISYYDLQEQIVLNEFGSFRQYLPQKGFEIDRVSFDEWKKTQYAIMERRIAEEKDRLRKIWTEFKKTHILSNAFLGFRRFGDPFFIYRGELQNYTDIFKKGKLLENNTEDNHFWITGIYEYQQEERNVFWF